MNQLFYLIPPLQKNPTGTVNKKAMLKKSAIRDAGSRFLLPQRSKNIPAPIKAPEIDKPG